MNTIIPIGAEKISKENIEWFNKNRENYKKVQIYSAHCTADSDDISEALKSQKAAVVQKGSVVKDEDKFDYKVQALVLCPSKGGYLIMFYTPM